MNLVVDANILFAAIIKRNISLALLLVKDIKLCAPEFIFDEIRKHKGILYLKSKLSEPSFESLLNTLQNRVRVYAAINYKQYITIAKSICPDVNDVPYFALCLKLKCALWSNDSNLRKQSFIKVMNTAELINRVF